MAERDTRALLAAARKDRRVKHPHASYTSSGNLVCNLCSCPVKSDAAWPSHLRSTGHALRLSREQDAAAARSNGTKRKASSPVADEDERKKIKSAGPFTEGASTLPHPDVKQDRDRPDPTPIAAADVEADLEALEASLVTLEREHQASNATISAPAQTAEEIAVQAREEQSAQRGKREEELEDEREEAARHLEEEFAEMEGLEDRVRKLRQRREKLRVDAEPQGNGILVANGLEGPAEEEGNHTQDDDDESSDDEEDDDWVFGAR